jgi:hypothetical protein
MKLSHTLAALLLAAAAICGNAQAADNLVLNSSFEDSTNDDNSGALATLDSWSFSASAASSWSLMIGSLSGLDTAYDGGQYLVFSSASTVSQTLTGLTVGSYYTLSFAVATGDGSNGVISASVNGTSLLSNSSITSAGWTVITLTNWQAQSASAVLSFTGSNSIALDGVTVSSVSAVPEPSSYAMLLAGLGMLGVVARRRTLR